MTLEELSTDPHSVHAALRRRGPVLWVEALRGWLVLDRSIAIEVMRSDEIFTVDHPGFTTARVVGPSMLSLDGSQHRRHRDPFADAFRITEIRRRFSETLTTSARELIDGFRDAGFAELRTELAAPFAVDVVAELLGLVGVDPVELLRLYRDIAGAVTLLSAGGGLPHSGREAMDELRAHVLRAGETGENILAEAAGELTGDEVVSNAAVMLFGGIETNEGMTAGALWYLLSEPGLIDAVTSNRDLVPPLIEESLRMEPAAARVDRYATVNTQLGDAAISKDDLVIVSLAAINRDPNVFDEPDLFRLDRAPNSHLAFALGPHVCIGQHLARMETAAAIDAVVDGLPGLELDLTTASGPQGLVFRKPVAVTARWKVNVG